MKSKYLALFPLTFLIAICCFGKDRLVLVSASYGKNILAITEANGDVIWSYKTAGGRKAMQVTTMYTCWGMVIFFFMKPGRM
jgi:outer membrane protein assembly factor BamB